MRRRCRRPAITGRHTACLAERGPAPAPEAAAVALLRALDHWRTQPFAAVRAAWTARGPQPGTPITLNSGARTTTGLYAGLAEDGSLLLDTGAGPRAYSTGETGG